MNFIKRVNGSWVDTPNYIHKTDTDTFTTLPDVVYVNDTTATVGLKGNMEQNGTPTPDNPIMSQETGERTGNLWDNRGFSATAIVSNRAHNTSNVYGTEISTTEGNEVTIIQSAYPTGNSGYQNGFFFIDVDFSKYAIGDIITISFDYIVNEIHALSTQKTTTIYAGKNNNAITPTLSSGDWKKSGRLTLVVTIIEDMNSYIEVRLCGNSITVKNIMLNSGSTALPYEPYGIKIPILSANTTTPVYLGEVESTRRIKKLVLTGEEGWRRTQSQRYYIDASTGCPTNYLKQRITTSICSHYQSQKNTASGSNEVEAGHFCFYTGGAFELYIGETTISSAADFKSYLAQQYSAGTPVTIWYVLATPETTVVNEPLRKIGDYADSVSGISIPTIAGANTISVGTTLQPSEVTATYKGWHPVSAVHERENGRWD